MNARRLLDRLDMVTGKEPKWKARCPAHDDNGPSLSIKQLDDGRVLIHCFAGCGSSDVMASVGMTLADLFPDAPLGELMAEKHREPENKLYAGGYLNMLAEIQKLRAAR